MLKQISQHFWQVTCLVLIITLSGISLITATMPAVSIPLTSRMANAPDAAAQTTHTLTEFVQSVSNGQADEIVGVYSAFTLALPVIDQPAGNPGYVADQDGLATQFQLATDAGSIGLLAHYQRSGKAFSELTPGQQITLIYGDGSTQDFQVENILYFQAQQPDEKFTSFVSLDQNQTVYTQEEVFNLVYRKSGRLVLQTCMIGQGSKTWGRMFVIAEPILE
jgi:hypothetical protein